MLEEFKQYYNHKGGKWFGLNKESGEVREFTVTKNKKTKKTTTTRTKKKKEDENPNPQVILEDNKYSLNSAAVALMNIEPDMKLCVKMKKIDGSMLPIIGTNTAFKVKDGKMFLKAS